MNRGRQRHGVGHGRRRLHQRQHLLDGRAEGDQPLVHLPLALGRPDPLQLPAHRGQEGAAVQALVLVEVVAEKLDDAVVRDNIGRSGYLLL